MGSIIQPMSTVKKRPYRSTIRRGDAPAAICTAARRLFSTRGYLATSIDDLAAEAGVARPTIFTAVGSKADILKAVVDHAMAGDDAPVPVADRLWFQEALDEPDPLRSLRLHVRNICRIAERVGPLLAAVQAAATVDLEVARMWAELLDQRRTAMTTITTNLAGKTALRCDTETAIDMLWAFTPDTYLRLVRDAGWSPERFESWLYDTLQRALIP